VRRAGQLARVCVALLPLLAPGNAAGGGSDLTQGREVYDRSCAVCHGADGDGAGEAAARFATKPRDFRTGVYKFRSTASGSLPTDDDLTRSIVSGLRGTAMVPQDHLSPEDVRAVVAYIKSFSPKFAGNPAPKPLALPVQVPREDASIERGKKMYVEAGCDNCHGAEGRGDGPAVATLSVQPANLTLRPFKAGSTPRDILRTIVTGLDGTPMPSYHLMLDDADFWALAYYVESLGGEPRMTEDERVGWEVEGRQPD
jgi:cytochrome c oxidase cbb3-type subunit 2